MQPKSTGYRPPTSPPTGEAFRRFSTPVGMVLALATLLFSIRVSGAKLFLVYLYGWSSVQQQHLRILAMPKGHPWPLSNGQFITSGFFVHYLISLACWFGLFVPVYLLVYRLLPRRRGPPVA